MMLKDSFGRIHDNLRISLLDKCNFRCLYCLPHSPHNRKPGAFHHENELMHADEVVRLARLFAEQGVKKIRLTGGEPLLGKDAGEIIYRLSELNTELTLTTNGSLLHEHIGVVEDAGITSVNVSLDSLQADTFQKLTGKNEFKRVMENIRLLLKKNFHLKINVVVMNGYNDEEIPGFIVCTKNTPVHIRFIEFMPFPGNGWRPEKLIRYRDIRESIRTVFPEFEKLNDGAHDTAKKFRVKNHAGTFAVSSLKSKLPKLYSGTKGRGSRRGIS